MPKHVHPLGDHEAPICHIGNSYLPETDNLSPPSATGANFSTLVGPSNPAPTVRCHRFPGSITNLNAQLPGFLFGSLLAVTVSLTYKRYGHTPKPTAARFILFAILSPFFSRYRHRRRIALRLHIRLIRSRVLALLSSSSKAVHFCVWPKSLGRAFSRRFHYQYRQLIQALGSSPSVHRWLGISAASGARMFRSPVRLSIYGSANDDMCDESPLGFSIRKIAGYNGFTDAYRIS